MSERISVVIPVYNVENKLDKTLESVCGQTYSNLEILLIDDGSTDKSLFKCRQWEEADLRVRVVAQENMGVSKARNKGIELSTGDYLMFVDGDDWIEKDMLENLYQLAKKYDADVANCTLQEESQEDFFKANFNQINTKEDVRITAYDTQVESGLALLTVWGPVCKLFKRSIIDQIRFEEYEVAEDLLFNTNVICQKEFSKVVTIYYPFYHYVIYPGSAMKQQFQEKYLTAMEVEAICYDKLTKLSPKFADINLIGCSVSRVFEKYAALSKEEKQKHKAEFAYCRRFAKAHKKALLMTSNRHRKISGLIKLYIPHIYIWLLGRRV